MPASAREQYANNQGLTQSDLFSAAQLVQRKITLQAEHQVEVRDSEDSVEFPMGFKRFYGGSLGWSVNTKFSVTVEVPDHDSQIAGSTKEIELPCTFTANLCIINSKSLPVDQTAAHAELAVAQAMNQQLEALHSLAPNPEAPAAPILPPLPQQNQTQISSAQSPVAASETGSVSGSATSRRGRGTPSRSTRSRKSLKDIEDEREGEGPESRFEWSGNNGKQKRRKVVPTIDTGVQGVAGRITGSEKKVEEKIHWALPQKGETIFYH